MRGGADGGRLRLAPQKDWAVNNPAEITKVLGKLEGIQTAFNKKSSKRKISLADMIVLGGGAAIEKAAKDAGHSVEVPFNPGRADASQAMTDVKSFNVLEPKADGFRNYYSDDSYHAPLEALIDRAALLDLTVPEMTVLIGGMRSLDANMGGADYGVFTNKPGTLNNDFFVNLLDMSTKWSKSEKTDGIYEGRDRKTGELKWEATPIDLIFGSNAELRAVAEYYGYDNADETFANDFVAAWTKVMNLGRF
jgi:catalase-peroxidase